MIILQRLLLSLGILGLALFAQAPDAFAAPLGDDAFPPADAASVGLDPAALSELSDVVAGFVDDGVVIGAELLVIKDRRTVLHVVHGLDDVTADTPLRREMLFNIRSMTKPVTGTLAQMLVDEGRLALDDHVARYVPAFDTERSRAITVEHLLTHRSGLPMSLAESFADLTSLADLADRAGEHGPEFEPGSDFHYSDAGSEALGRVLEVAAGDEPLAQLLQTRVLDPLGMTDSVPVLQPGSPELQRVACAYTGSPGSWFAYWTPALDPLYAFSLGSQGLYCTARDYARFLALWMDGGLHDGRRLLSEEAVARAFTPVSVAEGGATTLRGLLAMYGQMWIVYQDEQGALQAFAHSGSDGTWAWVWPAHDLMVLYFTQSRGQGSGMDLEREIDRLLVRPELYGGASGLTAELAACLGWYHDAAAPRSGEFEVLEQDGGLAVRLPQGVASPLRDRDADGRWLLTVDPRIRVDFERADDGATTAMVFHAGPQRVGEFVRGRAPEPEPLDLVLVAPLLGVYHDLEADLEVRVHLHDGGLAVSTPAFPVPLELLPPDGDDGLWSLALSPATKLRFDTDEQGAVVSYTALTPLGEFPRPRLRDLDEDGEAGQG